MIGYQFIMNVPNTFKLFLILVKLLKKITPSRLITNLVSSLLFAAIILTSIPSKAALDYGVGRIRTCNNESEGEVEGLDGNPTGGGKDIEFVMSNPVCVSVVASTYAATKIAIANMNGACQTGSPAISVAPSPLSDSISITRATWKAARPSSPPGCRGALAIAGGTFAASMAQLFSIYAIAQGVYQNTKICGSNWVKPNKRNYTISSPDRKQQVQDKVESLIRSNSNQLTLKSGGSKEYREWFYGGVEVEDNPADGEPCRDPTQSMGEDGEYPPQKYYLKGLETGNYNCSKYDLSRISASDTITSRHDDYRAAFACCQKRMKEYICIEKTFIGIEDENGNTVDTDRKFCRAGQICEIQGVNFSAKYYDNNRLVCAESYSLCPYNFSIGGGTEYCDYYRDGIWLEDEERWDMISLEEIENEQCAQNSEIRNQDCTFNEKAGKCQNYCQYLTHCTKTGSTNFQFVSSLTSPYYSQACIDFIGDSQNRAAFEGGFVFGRQRHFSAPIAQCVKESLENLFYNRAGHSKCEGVNEYPSPNGDCPSGQYVTDGEFTQKKGNQVKRESFFTIIQEKMNDSVKMVLTLSIMFYGMNILIGKNNIGDKKDILIYIVKIGLVLYFATGQAWQTMFFDGVYGSSMEFAKMVFKIETEEDPLRQDGCQFGDITLKDGSTISSGKTYPPGKDYLAIWDTLDCKTMRYLGFGPQVSAASIASIIIASFFTGPIGIYFALSLMFFGIFLIATTIRALHIFLSSAMLIILFVFISPVIIPMVLFEQTKNIFKQWLTNLITFILQPMILFAYIAILISVMDKVLIGSAEFVGDPPMKTVSCKERCYDSDGNKVPYIDNSTPPPCDKKGEELIDPMDDSVACLLEFESFGKLPGFEIIGLSFPIAINLFEKNTKQRILTILKAALMIYLLYKFMDQIPGIASALIGGQPLPGAAPDAAKMFVATAGVLSAMQQRAGRGLKKGAKNQYDKAKKGADEMTDEGKSTKESTPRGGSDGAGKSQEGSDAGGSSQEGRNSGGNSGDGGDTTRRT